MKVSNYKLCGGGNKEEKIRRQGNGAEIAIQREFNFGN